MVMPLRDRAMVTSSQSVPKGSLSWTLEDMARS
jgi:hypothetical protein